MKVAGAVEADDVVGGKHGVDVFAVTAGRGRGDAGLGVAHGAAGGPELPMPCHAAVLGVESKNVQARLGGAAAAGDNDMVAQHERAGKTAAGQGDGPLEAVVLQGGGEVFISGHAVAVRATELVPVLGLNTEAESERESDENVFHGNPF